MIVVKGVTIDALLAKFLAKFLISLHFLLSYTVADINGNVSNFEAIFILF